MNNPGHASRSIPVAIAFALAMLWAVFHPAASAGEIVLEDTFYYSGTMNAEPWR